MLLLWAIVKVRKGFIPYFLAQYLAAFVASAGVYLVYIGNYTVGAA
jgi:hypothetical protein